MKTIIIALLALPLLAAANLDPRVETAIATMRKHAELARLNAYYFELSGAPSAQQYFKTRAESFDEAAQYLTILFSNDLTNDATLNEPIHRTRLSNLGDTQDGLHGRAGVARPESGLLAERAKPHAVKSERRENDARANPSRN